MKCGTKERWGGEKKKSWVKCSGLFLFRGAIAIDLLERAADGVETPKGRVAWGVGGEFDETAKEFVDCSAEYNTKVLYSEGEDSFVKVSALAPLVSGVEIVSGLFAMCAKILTLVFVRA